MNGYVVVVEGDEARGFGARSPDLAGRVAAASTYEERFALIHSGGTRSA